MLDFNDFDVLTFDCYGTLIDWESGILRGLEDFRGHNDLMVGDDELLEQYAVEESSVQKEGYRLYKDVLREVMRRLALHYGATDYDEDALVQSLPGWRPFPDTVASLRALAGHFKLAIISNIDDDLFSHSAYHLQVPFEWVITAEQCGSYKPSPRNFERAFEVIAAPRERILHVAQSKFHDHAPAKELGMSTVWINRRHGRPGSGATHPSDAVPDVETPDLAGLVSLVEGSRA